MSITGAGEERAWVRLAAQAPPEVAARAGVELDPGGRAYVVRTFGRDLRADPATRRIAPLDPGGAELLGRCPLLLPLALPWYLAAWGGAQPGGPLVRPADLSGGDLFLRGTHVLPLDPLAGRYGESPPAFLEAGARAGGSAVAYGDAAVRLFPFPRLAVTVILRRADGEFPARADLLLDRGAAGQLPIDILWAAAAMSVDVLG